MRIDETAALVEWAAQYKDPCVLFRRAIYGLGRADLDWSEERHRRLVRSNWTELEHRKVYTKEFLGCPVRTGIYVDDALTAGARNACLAARVLCS